MKKTIIILGLAMLALSSCCNGSSNDTSCTDAKEAVLANIAARKSVRSYTEEAVSDADIQAMLKAAMAAPSAMNVQPWSFVVINGRENMDKLAESLPYARMLTSAPLAIVVCGNTTIEGRDGNKSENGSWALDCSAATENLLLAAEAMGLGAVWTGTYPVPDRIAAVKAALGLPEDVMPLNVVVIGHPAGQDEPKDKWNPEKIHYGRW